MAFGIKIWLEKFAGYRSALPSLDAIASSAHPGDPLINRLNWLEDLVLWIRRPGHEAATEPLPPAQLRNGRLRRFLDVLDRNPEWKRDAAATLRSIIHETTALDLFSQTGLPKPSGLFSEAGERLGRKLIPVPLDSGELATLFDRLFPDPRDADWIEKLEEATLERFWALLQFEVQPGELGWNSLREDMENSLLLLAAQLRVAGCSSAIRNRTKPGPIREMPMFKLGLALNAALDAQARHDEAALGAALNHLRSVIEASAHVADEVLTHLEKRGVNTDVVYQLVFIDGALARMEALLSLRFDRQLPKSHVAAFMGALVRQSQARRSLIDLFRQNLHLLTRKLVDRNAETGRHYIARTPKDYLGMLRSALGGGAIMGVTMWIKVLIFARHLPYLMQGLASSGNYAVGFVAIHLSGSTLATKQPSATAPTLAARIHLVRDRDSMEGLVDEIVCLIRSQFAAIAGNILGVIPVVLLIELLLAWGGRGSMLPVEKAEATLRSLSILGPSPIYAAFTGVLLWASSLAAAWADNWLICQRIDEALAADRRLIRIWGPTRTLKFAQFWRRNVGGIAGNVAFGFMIGMTPELAAFAGLPLDIRHVTLSSGMAAASVMALGPAIMLKSAFWLAAIGIGVIGLLNLVVSFALALFVAARAQKLRWPERKTIYRAVLQRFFRAPGSFLLPVGNLSSATGESH